MTVIEIIRPALVALANAYKTRHAGAPMPSDDVLMRYMLQQIQNTHAAKMLGLTLDESTVSEFIKPSALIALIRLALETKQLKIALSHSENEADEAWKRISSAAAILRKRSVKGTSEYKLYGTAHKRHSAALYELGLIGEAHGEGRGGIYYQTIADRYFSLRAGGYEGQRNGPPKKIEPHTHSEAVSTIFTEFNIDWVSLQRAWCRHGIQVSIKAEVFPKS